MSDTQHSIITPEESLKETLDNINSAHRNVRIIFTELFDEIHRLECNVSQLMTKVATLKKQVT